ncbi:hypothetical protein LPC08_10005 [Roseomonas sp. OT10]|uniref:hypothetical protein n=1 Tax=Roseomonas cutis TaxID=2897332 RepID=UPI001E2DD101|nr:hypothetical protein [Roseomonas sp. OT10]UFN50912.1 hypothetical protein LPC08_10005 [Roseomonas sp. OT10]
MSLRMGRLLILSPALLAACAQGPTLDQRLSTFVGRSELDLVNALGVPARTHQVDGVRFLAFESQRTMALPGGGAWAGPGPWGPYGGGWGWGWNSTSYAVVNCDVTFALRADRVESFSYRGEGCR